MEHGEHNFFVILDHFLHFYSPNNLKNQNFEKMKQPPRDIITLHMCTINGNHMMYGPEIWSKTEEFFVILDCFLPFWVSCTKFVPCPLHNKFFAILFKILRKLLLLLCSTNLIVGAPFL